MWVEAGADCESEGFRLRAATAMSYILRHNNAQSSVPLNVSTVEKSSLLYGNRQPVLGRKAWSGEGVAALGTAI